MVEVTEVDMARAAAEAMEMMAAMEAVMEAVMEGAMKMAVMETMDIASNFCSKISRCVFR